MSTPVIERPGTPGGGRQRPDTRQSRRTAAPPRIPAQRGPGDARRVADQRGRSAARENTGRAKFVLVVMVLLVSGLIATLWLSTAAANPWCTEFASRPATSRRAAWTAAFSSAVTGRPRRRWRLCLTGTYLQKQSGQVGTHNTRAHIHAYALSVSAHQAQRSDTYE